MAEVGRELWMTSGPPSCRITTRWLLYLTKWRCHHLSGQSVLSHPDKENCFLMLRRNFPCVCSSPLCPVTGHGKNLDPRSLHPPCRCLCTLLRAPELSPLQDELLQLTHHFLIGGVSVPQSPWWSFMRLSILPVSVLYWGAQHWTHHSRHGFRLYWTEGADDLLQLLNTPSSAAQCAISILFWCPAGAPGPFLPKLLPSRAFPTSAGAWGCSQLQDLVLSVLNCLRFLSAPFSSQSGSLWTAPRPSGVSAPLRATSQGAPLLCHLH